MTVVNVNELNIQVRIHPSSVLHSSVSYDSPYVVFHEKMKTSGTFILDCSVVPAFPLILCGGRDIHIKLHQGSFVLEVDDGWIKFVCDSHKVSYYSYFNSFVVDSFIIIVDYAVRKLYFIYLFIYD